jgi:predicted MFS family arabinose efflux permease
VFGPYLTVLRVPGAAKFSAAGFLARMQMSMSGLGAVLLISMERGSYAIAGVVSAIYALSNAVVSPQISRLIDRDGQHKVVPIQLLIHLPIIAGLILLAVFGKADWPLYPMAFLAGASQPNVGPLVRARWSALLSGTAGLRTAFAWESLIDEVVFITGPPLATILALRFFPSAALVVATGFLVVGVYLLLIQRRTEPAPSRASHGRVGRPAILLPGVAAVALVYVFVGGIFGAWEVTTVAFSAQHGQPGAAGVLLAVYSLGSLSGGLIFGALNLRASLLHQFLTVLAALAVVTLPLPWLTSLPLLGLGALVAGIAVAPVLISGIALVERVVPTARLTESMSWATAGLTVGLAIASPIAGVIVDSHSASTAYWITSGCAVFAALAAFSMFGSLHRADAAAEARLVEAVPLGV